MNENIKRILSAFFLGLVVAITTKILISGIGWQVLAGVFFFSTVLNIILEAGEADTALNRMGKRLSLIGAGILVFIAIRLAGDYIFGLPIGNVYGWGFGSVEELRNSAQTLTLEILFSIIGVGIAYKTMVSERARKWLYVASCLAFMVILYQVKAPEMNNAMSRVLKASGIRAAQSVAERAVKIEKDIEPTFGQNIEKTYLYELRAGGRFEVARSNCNQPLHLEVGQIVLFLGESRSRDGFVLMRIRLANKDTGDFIEEGSVAWVDSRAFKWGIKVGPNNKPT